MLANAGFHVAIGDDVQALAEQRHAPSLRFRFQKVRSALRLVHEKFKQVSVLLRFNFAGSAFDEQLASDHETKAITLFSFFQIVRGDEHRGARVGEAIDHCPERAARQRIDAGSRFIEKHNARFVHDRGAECHSLLPPARQAAGNLILFAFEPRKIQHPAFFFVAALPPGTP